MNQMELVEGLREKTGCSYAEAQAATEQTGGDLLKALCWLESHGKTQLVPFSGRPEEVPPAAQEPETEHPATRICHFLGRGFCFLGQGLLGLLHMGNRNLLVMRKRNGDRELTASLTVVILLLAAALWLALGLLALALFCGYRFSLERLPAADPEDSRTMDQTARPSKEESNP